MFRLGALLGFLAVALGAFAAHGLKNVLSEQALENFQTGVRYQMYHALAILVLGLRATRASRRVFRRSTWCFAAGILLFSGSLYGHSVTGAHALVYLTPVGGLLFLAGWLMLVFHKVVPKDA